MKLNTLMVQKQNLINLNWKPTQMVVEPSKYLIHFASLRLCVKLNSQSRRVAKKRKEWIKLENSEKLIYAWNGPSYG